MSEIQMFGFQTTPKSKHTTSSVWIKLIDLDFIVWYQITLKRQSCLKSNKLFGFWPQFSNLKFVSESKQIVWILAPNFKIYKFVSEIQTDCLDFRHIYKFSNVFEIQTFCSV